MSELSGWTCSSCGHAFYDFEEYSKHYIPCSMRNALHVASGTRTAEDAAGSIKIYQFVEEMYADRERAAAKAAGVKHDQEKPIMALIPPKALEEEGWVWTFGGKKYGYWNWKKGLVYTRIISAILRHTMSIMRGEDFDAESGKLHAAHIRCCAGMLIEFHYSNRVDLDDRDKPRTEKT